MGYKEEAKPIYDAMKARIEEYINCEPSGCLDGEANRAFLLDWREFNKQLREIKAKYEEEDKNELK